MPNFAHTQLGTLVGQRDQGVAVFRGVDYAQPPVGKLRFAAPVPMAPWQFQRDAGWHGAIAPQAPSRLAPAMGDFKKRMDEDCLSLTVWTPEPDGQRRPVLVWLHGGAWVSGAGSLEWYDGSRLAREGDVVVVGVNYRLGALGYLKHPALPAEDCGTLDQIAALAWVRDNIAAFGGDPGCVTVMGQSAGAASIGRLIINPAARALFHRAILQSGGFGRATLGLQEAYGIGAQVIRAAGLDPDAADILDQLRAVPAETLVAATGTVARANARFAETNPPFMPTTPEPLAQAELFAAIVRGARGLPVLIGATHDEVHAFFASNPAMAEPDWTASAKRFAELARRADAMERYRARRPGGSLMDWLADLSSDHTFLWPSMRLAEALAEAGVPVQAYQFDWAPQGSPFRACHCIELPFVFGNFAQWPDAGMLQGGEAAEMDGLSANIRAAWTAFARTGDASVPGLPWPRYDAARRLTMRLDATCAVVGDPAGLETRA
ncbi:MAG: carboxylesterase/lipase family protein [Acetobacteraceae bacterium]|nr:carboxylesterase/lipase family protein [Acetobacteraceae bacterium]